MKKKALIFTENSDGVLELAQFLLSDEWEIISNGNAAAILQSAHIPFITNEALQSTTQWNDTFLNTLRSIISTRLDSSNLVSASDSIFLVCINIDQNVRGNITPKSTIDDDDQNPYSGDYIDVKYISLIRAAARNYRNVIVLTDPEDYSDTIIQLMTGSMSAKYRLYLAGKALNFTAVYDAAFSNRILFRQKMTDFPKSLIVPYRKLSGVSQGLNPGQAATLYTYDRSTSVLSGVKKLQGTNTTFGHTVNYFFAWDIVSMFLQTLKNPFEVQSTDHEGHIFPTLFTSMVDNVLVVGVKHGNLIGAALGEDAQTAFQKAYNYSSESFERACIGCSSVIDKDAAEALSDKGFYLIIAPDFTKEARSILARDRDLRLVVSSNYSSDGYEVRSVDGGILAQSIDKVMFKKWVFMTHRRPTQEQADSLALAVMLNMKAKSDSVLILNDTTIIACSVAMPSRKKALRFALQEAKNSFDNHLTRSDTSDEVLVCDTSIAFDNDVMECVAAIGVKAILEEGGEDTDAQMIDFCEKHNIALVFTKVRHICF